MKPNQRRTLKGDREILLKRAHDVSDRERLITGDLDRSIPPSLAAYEHKAALLPYLDLYQLAWCRTGSRHLDLQHPSGAEGGLEGSRQRRQWLA